MLTATDAEGELPEALQKLDPHIVELVCNEVVDRGAGVAWDDIAGQEAAKKLVQELVVWPMLNPHLFKVWPAMPLHLPAAHPPAGLLCQDTPAEPPCSGCMPEPGTPMRSARICAAHRICIAHCARPWSQTPVPAFCCSRPCLPACMRLMLPSTMPARPQTASRPPECSAAPG